MPSLVLSLQQLALKNDCAITNLLMQALVVARKLKVKEFEIWVKNELEGYRQGSEVPEYRKNRCQLKIYNPYHGWQDIIFATNERQDILSNVQIIQPISEIEQLRKHSGSGGLIMPMPSEMILHIQKAVKSNLSVERFAPTTAIDKICEGVRKVILEWALDLEERGVLGDEASFSEEEKTIASQTMPQFIIQGDFNGIFGNINSSSINQEINSTVKANDFESLKSMLKNIGIHDDDIESLAGAIKEEPNIESPNKLGKKVADWVGKMTSKAITGTWKIATGIPSQILTRAICHYYGF